MKIVGVGNAIVDILCEVDDQFLEQNKLKKGSMHLIDEETAKKFSQLNPTKITSGGSAGNTISTLAQLGCNTFFIGQVGSDEFGKKFISEIESVGTKFLNTRFNKNSSAVSFILVTPDAQRTMCTFLGCASEMNHVDVNDRSFMDSKIAYLEGYFWNTPESMMSMKKCVFLAKKSDAKVALSLSDSSCVSRHKDDFLELIENYVDIIFANESEALELSSNYHDYFIKKENILTIVTKSDQGCEIFYQNQYFTKPAIKVEKPIDTTGAGDAFAAGFLFAIMNNLYLDESAEFANFLGGSIIQKFGARFEKEEILKLKTQFFG